MNDQQEKIYGMPPKQWEAAFRPGMPEFAASMMMFSREADGMVRIAFGNSGPYVSSAGERSPVFTHAVTLTPALAVDIARLLLKAYAEPESDKTISSAQL